MLKEIADAFLIKGADPLQRNTGGGKSPVFEAVALFCVFCIVAAVVEFQRKKHLQIAIANHEVNVFLGDFIEILHIFVLIRHCEKIFKPDLGADETAMPVRLAAK